MLLASMAFGLFAFWEFAFLTQQAHGCCSSEFQETDKRTPFAAHMLDLECANSLFDKDRARGGL